MEARAEMEQLITELGNGADEARAGEIAERVNELSPDPNWSDYIFHSDEFIGDEGTLLMEQLLDKILSYRAIQL